MVRLLPANLARLVTIALQNPLNQDGAAPAAAGVTNIGMSPALSAVPPAVPTGYRSSSHAAVKGEMPPKETSKYKYGVRTAGDERVPAQEALQRLMDGNERFLGGKAEVLKDWNVEKLTALAEYGQAPMASVLGCADSRAPVELLFDALPGDIFVLRNAGNTLSNAEGSMVGSLEFSVNALGVKLVVVLGHTECGAIKGATGTMLNAQKSGAQPAQSSLDTLLSGLSPVVQQAQLDLGGSDSDKEIATKAVEVNVFAGIQKLLVYSESIREKVKSGEVQVHGAVYDIKTGKVDFLGQHPRLPLILGMQSSLKK